MLSYWLSLYSESATDWIAKSGDKFQLMAQDFSVVRNTSKESGSNYPASLPTGIGGFFPTQNVAETWSRPLPANYRLS
jgi:hypothetical protein